MKSRKTHLGNVAKNKCAEFGPNRSTAGVLKFGGTKMAKKYKKPSFFEGGVKIVKNLENPTWGMSQRISVLSLVKIGAREGC